MTTYFRARRLDNALSKDGQAQPVLNLGGQRARQRRAARDAAHNRRGGTPIRKNGDAIAYVPFADSMGAFGWMNTSHRGLAIAYDGTGRGLLEAVTATMQQQGIKRGARAPVIRLPVGAKAQGSFEGADIRGYVITGAMPVKAAWIQAQGATFWRAGGGMTAPEGRLSFSTFNDVNADFLKARYGDFSGLRVFGHSTARFISAQRAAFDGGMFNDISDGDLGGARLAAKMDNVAANYVSFCGAELRQGLSANNVSHGPSPAVVTRDPAFVMQELARGGVRGHELRHDPDQKSLAQNFTSAHDRFIVRGMNPLQASANDNEGFHIRLRTRRPDELKAA